MHLKAIKLRGFKSFVDPVEVRLEPGVAVVVGPNGSGKSNISDSILWATGSLSPHELRAERPDDVLFAGSAGRKAIDACEVELIFDNEDRAWPGLPFAEVSLARRLQRGGEGQYLVNRAAVRRLDLVELLSDVGLGGGLRSVISQGSVESVLGARPAERRSLVEEAAGLGRFKLRRHRAELKLNRVATQVERARDLEDEVRKRLRPLALQATAAERAAKLVEELARIHAAIATHDLARLTERRAGGRASPGSGGGRPRGRRAAARAPARCADSGRGGAHRCGRRPRGRDRGALPAPGRVGAARAAAGIGADAARPALGRPRGRRRLRPRPIGRARRPRAGGRGGGAGGRRASARGSSSTPRSGGPRWPRSSAAVQAAIGERLEQLARERAVVEAELVGGGRNALLALRDAAQRLGLRQESNGRLRDDLRRELAEAASLRTTGPAPAELGAAADEADAAARAAARERDDLAARAALAAERRAALERSLAEREGLPPAARELAERGERLALSLLDVPPGEERAVAAALGRLASAIVSDDPAHALALLEHARSGGLGSLVVLVGRDPRALVESLPVVEREALLDSSVPAVTRDGLGWDPLRGELWFAGETAEAVLLELEGRRREVGEEADRLSEAAAESARAATAAAERARARGGGVRAGRAPPERPPPRPGAPRADRGRGGTPRRDVARRRRRRRAARAAARRPCGRPRPPI